MHNVYRLPDTHTPAINHPSTERDVILATRQLIERIASGPLPTADSNAATVFQSLPGWMARTGLLGISICAEHGGPDIANAAIAEMIALFAGCDVEFAEKLAGHFQVLDAIRAAGDTRPVGEFLSRALAGELFLLMSDSDVSPILSDNRFSGRLSKFHRLSHARGGYRLFADLTFPSAASWLAVPCVDPEGQRVLALFARPETTAATARDTGATLASGDPSDLFIPSSHAFPIMRHDQGPVAFDVMGSLLDAAVDLGIARMIFEVLGRDLQQVDHGELGDEAIRDRPDIRTYGLCAAQLDGVSSLIERAGQHMDMAQVDHSTEILLQASLSADSAAILAAAVLNDLRAVLKLSRNEGILEHVDASMRMRPRNGVSEERQERLGQLHTRGVAPPRWPFTY